MGFASLAEWLDWQSGLHVKSIDLGLDRVRAVWERLGAPDLGAAVISVAGTNGKGSSVAFCEAILHQAGYRCGAYTSPHLIRYNERIRVDGEPADDRTICDAFERIEQARGDTPLTYFEFGTLAALLVFADARLDAVVLEVGLGGRLDAVNLVDADVALICSIGLDHQEWLGDDRESIGREKAGIFRADTPAVFSGDDIPQSVRDAAANLNTRLLVAGEDFTVQRVSDHWDLVANGLTRRALPLPSMRGVFQLANAAGAIVALDCLAERLPLQQSAVRAGLLAARISGRFDVRPGRPTWVLDVAHNPQAADVLDRTLGDFFVSGDRIAVCGMLEDKDSAQIASVLRRRFDRWFTIDLSAQPRGLTASALAERIRPALPGLAVVAAGNAADLFEELSVTCGENDLVVVFGSFLTVSAAAAWLAAGDVPASRV